MRDFTLVNIPDIHFFETDLVFDTIEEELLGKPVVLVYDRNVLKAHPMLEHTLSKAFRIVAKRPLREVEPLADGIEESADAARAAGSELVISVGGGSTIDTAKGVALLVPSARQLPEDFQTPGDFDTALSHIAIPTTAGPGAEVSPAMVYRTNRGCKTAVVDSRLIPHSVIIFPQLATSLPPFETTCCLFDGICHSIESWLAPRSSYLAKSFAVGALRAFIEDLPRAVARPANKTIRARLALASVISSLGLQSTNSGAAHALSNVVPPTAKVPHGALVSAMLLALLSDDLSTAEPPYPFVHLATALNYRTFEALLEHLLLLYQVHMLGGIVDLSIRTDLGSITSRLENTLKDARLTNHPASIDSERALRVCTAAIRLLQSRSIDALRD
jgi:alcohol dehydrogenase class IV